GATAGAGAGDTAGPDLLHLPWLLDRSDHVVMRPGCEWIVSAAARIPARVRLATWRMKIGPMMRSAISFRPLRGSGQAGPSAQSCTIFTRVRPSARGSNDQTTAMPRVIPSRCSYRTAGRDASTFISETHHAATGRR